MPYAIVTGSGGLIGSEAVRRLTADGFDVVGLNVKRRSPTAA
jgi:nucleoside-diphosphate-sugar epimerase